MPSKHVPVIDLSQAPGQRTAWDRPSWLIYLWGVFEIIFITNSWQPSSKVRVGILKLFGSKIGKGVLMRPGVRVKFPWKLSIGDHSWIGEGVWIHNQDKVTIGANVTLSQETFVSTGSHAYKFDMALLTKPIEISDGAWVTSRCMILGGSYLGKSCLITPMSLVSGQRVPDGQIWGGNPLHFLRDRFE